jgi:hypothetical protein
MRLPHNLAVLGRKLIDAGCGPIRPANDEYRCRCPAHDDNGPSLYIAVTEGKILLKCNAGCGARAICDRLDHALADLNFAIDDPFVDVDADFNDFGEAAPGTDETSRADPAVPPAVPSDAQAAEVARRGEVYERLLYKLELSSVHFDALKGRGLSADEITRRGYRTADGDRLRKVIDQLLGQYGRDRLLTVPGFLDRGGRVVFSSANGLLIPARRPGGAIAGIKVRHDDGRGSSKYSWASSRSASCGNVVHVPLGVTVPTEVLRLTEGELKADVATALSKVPTLSAPGVRNWPQAVPTLKSLGARRVLLAFDRDGKRGTLAEIEKALYGLTDEGLEVVAEWWEGALGKGIDDLLAAGHQPEVLPGLVAAARVRRELSPPASAATDAEPEPAPCPVDVFPPALADYCRQVATATSTPPDFAAMTMLGTAGAAVGNSRALCLKEGMWYEAARFYVVNVGHPASGKTPAMDTVVQPYVAMQHRLLKAHKDSRAAYEKAVATHEQVAKANRGLPRDERLEPPPPPEEPQSPERLVVMDATVESLAPLLQENPRGLLMVQDEGVGWVRAMGQYKGGRGNDRQFWLSTWSGKSHLVDRKGQGTVPISIPRPFVNVICGIQPDMLNELADYQGRNDGFLHRLLFTWPKAPGGPPWTETAVSPAAIQAWADTLSALRRLAMKELDDGMPGYEVVKLSAEAREAWIAWWDAHAEEINGSELPITLIGPWGKLKSYAARLILVLHLLWAVSTGQGEGDVNVATVERAVRLIDYLKGHLRLVYGRLRHTPAENHLMEVLDWIRRQGGQCTVRDLVHAKKVTPTSEARKMVKELEDRGYGRTELREGGNGRPVPWFVFDPA